MLEKKEHDDIVITGISGLFPSSKNIKEFENNLYNKINMMNCEESRWSNSHPTIPKFSGKLPDIKHFDAIFFGIHQSQVDHMDPQSRLLIEEAFKAIMDAGVNPASLRGSHTGVFIGSCLSESENVLYYDTEIPNGLGITGCSKAMFANRISYLLGFTGPSIACDTACSSSLYALDLAYNAINSGEIHQAIVGAANLCLHPNVSRQFQLLGLISPTGDCCPFDRDANGYNRSEAVCCIFLQKKSNAKRVYGSVVCSHVNCDGYKPEGIFAPSLDTQETLLTELYAKSKVNVNQLGYYEAHATGRKECDITECKAIDNVIGRQRKDPLLLGSVKSNCGHCESASGICSIAKVLLSFQNGIIPANINLNTPNPDIKALKEGRLQLVIQPTKLSKPYVGISSFGLGGSNAHVLLKQYEKEKQLKSNTEAFLTRLVLWSSRTEESMNRFLENLETEPFDDEYLAIVQNAQAGGIPGMMFRGYSILENDKKTSKTLVLEKQFQHYAGIVRPVVWVFSGMGSQWVGMGKTLMQIPVFRKSIEKSHKILKNFGVNLTEIITTQDSHIFDNAVHSFVGITGVQIGLVDVLREIGVSPDFIIGHSLGEVCCAYADNCSTAEQAILAAYYRGKVCLETKTIKGAMAAVGLGYNNLKKILPETIEVACHNSPDSCTISGPYEDILKFIETLKKKNIFSKEVQCSNIAFHSKYISNFGPVLLKYMKKIYSNLQPRSSKWISTSIPRNKWLDAESKYSTPEYHTNNVLNNVLFEEGASFIPKNAITIEIAPNAFFRSILDNAIPEGIHVGLTKRASENSTLFLLNSLGRLYINGIEMSINKLYSEINWPVSRGTRSLSNLIDFDQSRDNYTYKFTNNTSSNGTLSFQINKDENFGWVFGHEIDKRSIIPATFYLECVWKTFATVQGCPEYDSLPVEFENVKFERATPLSTEKSTTITVIIQKGSGKFEITESRSLIAMGYIRKLDKSLLCHDIKLDTTEKSNFVKKNGFYKELKMRGYEYKDRFKAVEMASINDSWGQIKFENWTIFMDCMIQLLLFGVDTRALLLPRQLLSLRIDPQIHKELLKRSNTLNVLWNTKSKCIISGGIEFVCLSTTSIQKRKMPGNLVIEKYEFTPYNQKEILSVDQIAKQVIQLSLENRQLEAITVVEIISNSSSTQFLPNIIKAIGDMPKLTGNYINVRASDKTFESEVDLSEVKQLCAKDDLSIIKGNIVITEILFDSRNENSCMENILKKSDFIVLKANKNLNVKKLKTLSNFTITGFFPSDSHNYLMLYKLNTDVEDTKNLNTNLHILEINSLDMEFKWVNKLQQLLILSSNILLVAQGEKFSGILGLVNCLRKEAVTKCIRCVFICDEKAPRFDVDLPLYGNQIKLGLAFNIYKNGVWGTYRYQTLSNEYTNSPRVNHVYGNIIQIGDLSSLNWFEGPLIKTQQDITVVYSSLNFKDVMQASGRLPITDTEKSRLSQTCVFGFEYSGINKCNGLRVMGMTQQGAVSSHLHQPPTLYWEVPQNWSLRDAATVPVVYLTVYYAFFYTADIRKGKSILIHAGSGGIGLASIRVALAYGLKVFTTVSTEKKKILLLEMFPALNKNHIGNSRDTSFENMIMEQTAEVGVDFVLNSLSEDKLKASIRCLAKRGNFMEIGKFDIANNNDLDLGAFLNELSFHSIFVENLLNPENEKIAEAIKTHISEDIQKGIIQPLPSKIFAGQEIKEAFRYLMSGNHIGKVLIQMRKDSKSESTLPITVLPQTYFSPELTYVVPGGLGEFGLELVDWIILRGARKIVLNSRHGISSDYQKLRIARWKSYSCKILINTFDISTQNGCLHLFTEALNLGLLGGVFNLAVILKDGDFNNQTTESFQESFKPKAMATKYLDELSRKLYPNLQHFVIFSSVSCGRGNAGQTNYGMANSIMERIIEDRVENGFAGKAIQWGLIGEVNLSTGIEGVFQQSTNSCFEVLDKLIFASEPIVSSMIVAEKTTFASQKTLPLDFILGTLHINDIKSVSVYSTLTELGMDSLMVVEVQQGLEAKFDIILNVTDIRTLTITQLINMSKDFENNKEIKK